MNKFEGLILKKWIIPMICLVLISLVGVSCLKSGEGFPSSKDDVIDVVLLGDGQIPDSYTTSSQAFTLSGAFENDTSGFDVILQYSGASDFAPQDITLTLGVDTAALNTYNTQNSTDYVAFDSSMLSYSKTVTIKKGTDRTILRIVISDAKFDFATTYALPLKIISTTYGTVAANGGTKIYAFTAKNDYDGEYTVTGTFSDLNFPAYKGIYPKTVDLVSTGINTNSYLDVSTYSSAYIYYFFNTGTSVSYYGNFSPIFTFTGNKVTAVTNAYGQGTNTSLRYAELNPSGINTVEFDDNGTPKTISVSYYMKVGAVGSGAIRVAITEVYTYAGVR
ncbi:DUF1735 domain-containing protein [Rhizosphaericola mali]|uniref:DUF1735 domain-containing protein n=1 Tax=Rhizosphaericola mali TaxID=2545455 RepID=A0A5P2GB04_9BACT|nr:DUF1735 domain-containing protein [Rhizosphaericola mali]QES90383.1 DUF1735 domain-containing protein [Rhizosphaericola mali]